MIRKPIIITFLIIIVCLTGCVKGSEEKLNVEELQKTFEKASEAMAKQKNYSIASSENNYLENTKAESYYKVCMNGDYDGLVEYTEVFYTNNDESTNRLNYNIITPDKVTIYSDYQNSKWYKNEISHEQYDRKYDLNCLFKDATATFIKQESVDNVKCNVFKVKIRDLSSLNPFMPGPGYDIDDEAEFMMYIDAEQFLVRRISGSKKEMFDFIMDFSDYSDTEVYVPVFDIEEELGWQGRNPDAKKKVRTRFSFTDKFNKLDYQSSVINIDFYATDAIEHPTKEIIYLLSSNEKALYEVNYKSKNIRKVTFDLVPERMVFSNDRIYVTLLTRGAHYINWNQNDQTGAVAVMYADSMTIDEIYNVRIDPYYIAVDNNGYIYLSSGSGQDTIINSYNKKFKLMSTISAGNQASIRYNDALNVLYSLNGLESLEDFRVIPVVDGLMLSSSGLYENNDPVNEHFRISPDGRFVFNSAGAVLKSSADHTKKLTFIKTLEYPFDDIAFDIKYNQFYTSHGDHVLLYDYIGYDILGYYDTHGRVMFMFSKENEVITVGYDEKGKYYIEVMNVKKGPASVNDDKFKTDGDNVLINIEFTDIEKHPQKNIYYFTSPSDKTMYMFDYETKKVNEVKFTYAPERLTFSNNKIYVTLLKGYHSENWEPALQKGGIAVINAATLEIEKILDINQDPFDIAVDKNGYIYITPGSDQTGRLTKYSPSGEKLNGALFSYRQFIIYNQQLDKLYTVSTTGTPINIGAWVTDYEFNGPRAERGDEPYTSYIRLSPDGRYLFNGSGDVFSLAQAYTDDLKKAAKLPTGYNSIAFSGNEIYVSEKNRVHVFDYTSYEFKYRITSVKDKIHSLYYNDGKLYAMTVNESGVYKLEPVYLK